MICGRFCACALTQWIILFSNLREKGMSEVSSTKKLPLKKILQESFGYCNQNPKMAALFVVLNYLTCAGVFYTWKSGWLWLVVAVMYVLWSGFFRYYFNRKPYLQFGPLASSLVPSTKILVLTVVVVSIFLLLPFAIIFIPNLPPKFVVHYSHFLQMSSQGGNDVLNTIANLVIVLFSPLIFYRPMLAWIATLIGRSGSLRFTWSKTKGNYWKFLLLAVIIDLSMSFVYKGVLLAGGSVYAALIPLSVLVVYYNIVLARLYEFFFLEIEPKE